MRMEKESKREKKTEQMEKLWSVEKLHICIAVITDEKKNL